MAQSHLALSLSLWGSLTLETSPPPAILEGALALPLLILGFPPNNRHHRSAVEEHLETSPPSTGSPHVQLPPSPPRPLQPLLPTPLLPMLSTVSLLPGVLH